MPRPFPLHVRPAVLKPLLTAYRVILPALGPDAEVRWRTVVPAINWAAKQGEEIVTIRIPEVFEHSAHGRIVTSDPCLPAIPNVLRGAFVPEPGWLFADMDFVMCHWHIAAQKYGDKLLSDLYRMMASCIDGVSDPRAVAKRMGSAFLCGGGVGAMQGQILKSMPSPTYEQYQRAWTQASFIHNFLCTQHPNLSEHIREVLARSSDAEAGRQALAREWQGHEGAILDRFLITMPVGVRLNVPIYDGALCEIPEGMPGLGEEVRLAAEAAARSCGFEILAKVSVRPTWGKA